MDNNQVTPDEKRGHLSAARLFFDEIVAGGFEAIEKLVAEKQHETEWLDLKRIGQLADNERNWSKALAGFSNNQGGVVVWGVDARKDPKTEVDAASEVILLDNPAAIRTNLLERLRDSVEPPVTGVEITTIYKEAKNGPGCVACFIPESTNKPHRALKVPGWPYYIRIGETFHNPGPSLLRNLFFPRSSPLLEINLAPTWTADSIQDTARQFLGYEATITNRGSATAKNVIVIIQREPTPMEYAQADGFRVTNSHQGHTIECTSVIHPQQSRVFLRIGRVEQPVELSNTHERVPSFGYLTVNFSLYADDMAPAFLSAHFDRNDIADRISKQAKS